MPNDILKMPGPSEQLKSHGISLERARSQIEIFRKGVRPAVLVRPCTLGDGIASVSDRREELIRKFDEALAAERKFVKFVPASGAASRMFRQLLAAYGEGGADKELIEKRASQGDENCRAVLRFIQEIDRFAFRDELSRTLESEGMSLDSLLGKGEYGKVVAYVTGPEGLDYAELPKGLIQFHRYPDHTRTAFEEHLVEALEYTAGPDKKARVHFTVSPEHLDRVKNHIEAVKKHYEKNGNSLDVEYSVQKPSTDTLAVDMDNKPFLDSEGKLVLRPGGHGALLENLNGLDCDAAFIKNIDNVVPDRLKGETYEYKKALGGLLVEIQDRLAGYMRAIDEEAPGEPPEDAAGFARDVLGAELPAGFEGMTPEKKAECLRSVFDRPLRVCGVVRNEGEPGGGPFWTEDVSGRASGQIVESAQVDMDDPAQKEIWESSTHFNPVDIVCGLRNYRGKPYDLSRYSDPGASFISLKSKEGRDLKALELPGLWNGSMAYWNSVFVEVPLGTFNPVKTVFDLLRPEHQPKKP